MFDVCMLANHFISFWTKDLEQRHDLEVEYVWSRC